MPDATHAAVAGVILADGRRVFVSGAAADLQLARQVWVLLDGVEVHGRIHIPPDLLIWCDPTVPLAPVVGSEADPPSAASLPDLRPLALFSAGDPVAGEQPLPEMLAMAAREAGGFNS